MEANPEGFFMCCLGGRVTGVAVLPVWGLAGLNPIGPICLPIGFWYQPHGHSIHISTRLV